MGRSLEDEAPAPPGNTLHEDVVAVLRGPVLTATLTATPSNSDEL